MVKIDYAEKLHPIFTKRKRVKIVVGGRASTKSTGVADYVAAKVSTGELWCCARENQNSIEESVHRTILDEISRIGLQGFSDTKTSITHTSGGRTFYRGLARNITSLKSTLSGVHGLWIEEGEDISANTLRVLTASVRLNAKDSVRKLAGEDVPDPEIIITMNRGSRTGAVAQKWLARAEPDLQRCGYYEDDVLMVVQLNYTDIPQEWFLASGLEQERKDDEIALTTEQYRHKWLGDYMDEVANATIKKEWFDAAIDAHIKLGITPKGATIATHDPADGGDSYGYACRTGILYHDVDELVANNGNEACDLATGRAINANADLFVYDADGMGALLRNQIAESFKGIKCQIRPYKGSNAVDEPKSVYGGIRSLGSKDKPKTNQETFKNKRAQYGIKLADRFFNTYLAVVEGKYIDPDTIISLSSKIKLMDKLRAEVCRIPTVPNGAGKIQLMSKDQLKREFEMESPGMYDCLTMGEEVPEIRSAPVKLNFRRAV